MFANTLPPDYVNRVWDVFLYEGMLLISCCEDALTNWTWPPAGPLFLFRVGLAVISSCRLRLLESTPDRSSVLALLAHPPPSLLPPDPDALITVALSVKLKDDDIRRQRVKLEAQLKRQTQHPQHRAGSAFSSAISLPRS